MLRRAFLLLVAVFWVLMNLLLWRAEFGGRNELGGEVPVQVVWNKVLTALDHSMLSITQYRSANKIGYFNCIPGIIEQPVAPTNVVDELSPEGMMQTPAGYKFDIEGNIKVRLEDWTNRVSLTVNLKFDTNQMWQELHAKIHFRPETWEIHARADTQTVRLELEDEEGKIVHGFKFVDFANPEKIIRQLSGPVIPEILSTLGLPLRVNPVTGTPGSLRWESRKDCWLKLGSERMRCYRLKAVWLERFEIVLYVSQTGEILRLELPGELVVLHDSFTH